MKKQPLVLYVKTRQNQKRQKKDGTSLKYKCPSCEYSSFHKSRAILHISKCDKDNGEPQQLEDQPINNLNHQNVISDQSQLINIRARLERIEMELTTHSPLSFMAQEQRNKYKLLSLIVQQIMISAPVYLEIIKTNLLKQLNSLVQLGYSTKDLLIYLKPTITQTIQQINFTKNFSTFRKNMSDFQLYLNNQFKKTVNQTWYGKVMRGWRFLKKYKQVEFIQQHRIIEDISKENYYMRVIIVKVYKKMTVLFSDKFPWKQLPTRLTKKSSVITLNSNKLHMDDIKFRIRQLIDDSQFELATDLWMATTMGLRLKQLKKVQFRSGTGEIVDKIRIFQNKNRNITIRIVPFSLKNMINTYDVTYPITAQRLKTLKNYCFRTLHAFYGLRSLCITSIIQSLIATQNLARFHKTSSTTIKYYINKQSAELIEKVFSLQGFKNNLQPSGVTISINEQGQIQYLSEDREEEFQIDSRQTDQFIQQKQKDSLSLLSEVDLKTLINQYQISEVEKNQINFEKFQLIQNLQIDKRQFQSISEALLGEPNAQNQLEQSATISQKYDTSIKIITFDDSKGPTQMNIKHPESSEEIVLVKRVKNDRTFYHILEDTPSSNLLREKTNRTCKKRTYLLPQNLPQLQKKQFICPKCQNGQLQLKPCIKNKRHLMVICQKCVFIHHQCQQNTENLQTQSITSTSTTESFMFMKSIRSENTENNIREILKLEQKTLLKVCQFKEGTPNMNCKFPKFSAKFKKQILYNRNHETFLPLEIKKTQNMGYGVFSKTKIHSNSLVCCYTGVIGTNNNINFFHDSFVHVGWVRDRMEILNVGLEADKFCNVGRYLNSSISQKDTRRNCDMVIGLIQSQFTNFEIVFLLYSSKDIEPNQQLLWYYGDSYWQQHNQKAEQSQSKSIIYQKAHSMQDEIMMVDEQQMQQDQLIEDSGNQQQLMQIQESQIQIREETNIKNSGANNNFQPSKMDEQQVCTGEKKNKYPRIENISSNLMKVKMCQNEKKEMVVKNVSVLDSKSDLKKSKNAFKKQKNDPANARFNSFGVYCQNKQVVYQEHEKFEIASIVKLFLFLYCQRKITKKQMTQNELFMMPKFEADNFTSSNLVFGQFYTFSDLIHGMIIASGCDAAYCIGINIAQKYNEEFTQAELVQWMVDQLNSLVKQIGLKETIVTDFTGLGRSQSSVSDIKTILMLLQKSERFQTILAKPAYLIKMEKKSIAQKNTNLILSSKVLGKTGNGQRARFCFAGFKVDQQKIYFVIILGAYTSNSRFDQVLKLIEEIKHKKS